MPSITCSLGVSLLSSIAPMLLAPLCAQNREFEPSKSRLAARAALHLGAIACRLPDAVDDRNGKSVAGTSPVPNVVFGWLGILRVAIAFEQLCDFRLHWPSVSDFSRGTIAPSIKLPTPFAALTAGLLFFAFTATLKMPCALQYAM